MPVEIKELVIRAVTTLDNQSFEQPSASQSMAEERDAIVRECVRQVMLILKKKEQR